MLRFQKEASSSSWEDFSQLAITQGEDNHSNRARYRKFLLYAIQTLPPHQQEALILHDLQEHTMRECARLLRVDPSTVCRWVNAAKKRLRNLAQLCEKSGLFPN